MVALTAMVWALGGNALAQGADPSNVALAETLFTAGRALMDEQRYAEACTKFEESNRLDPSAGTVLNLGRCLELQGKTASAWARYKEAIVLGNATGKPRQVTAAETYIADIEPRLSKLEVVVTEAVPGLRIRAGAVEVGEAARGLPFPIDPGNYTITAEAPGYEPWRAEVELGERASKRIEIPALAKRPGDHRPPELQPSTQPNAFVIAGSVVGGAGVVSVAIGAVFGGLVLSDTDELETDPTLCPDHRCTSEGLARLESTETKATVSTATLVAGGIAVAGGATLLAIGLTTKTAPPQATVAPLLGDTMGLVVLGVW